MTCRVCNAETKRLGHLHKCTQKQCVAAHWDKYAIKRILKTNKETADDKQPKWMETILSEANVPAYKRGEYYVYTLKLKKNLPTNTPSKLKAKSPNNGRGRFYVGMTGLHPYTRYLNHLRGYKSPWLYRKTAVAIATFEGPMSREQAVAREVTRAEELRAQGYDVHGGH